MRPMTDQPDRPPDSIAQALTRVGGRETDGVEFAGAFPTLDEAQLTGLRRFGTEAEVARGYVLFREGQRDADCIVVLTGGAGGDRPLRRQW